MAILADEVSILIDRQQLLVHILSRADFVVTLSARRNRNIGFEASQRRGFRDVDVARRTLLDVILFLTAALVNEFGRDARRLSQQVRIRREFVAAIAIRSCWLLRLPVTVETRSVIRWRGFERCGA